jgi:diguanylate cyclase (GGDEF)-like protein/PAS domain S-box-containing protein
LDNAVLSAQPHPFSAIRSDESFRIIFDAVNDGVFITNAMNGQVIEVNESGCRMFGYDRSELVGRNVMGILSSGIPPYTEQEAMERLGKKSALGGSGLVDWQGKTRDGRLFWIEVSVRYMELEDIPVVIAILRDTTERKQLDAEMLYMAQHDGLTGLANRTIFTRGLEYAIGQALRAGRPFAVLSLDLDHFKDVNDTRGHLAGDRLLGLVAERLKAGVRPNDMVARFGGDEFAVLLRDFRGSAEVAALANRLIASIGSPFIVDEQEVHVGVSIGVAVSDKESSDVQTVLSQADIALYRSKSEGRNTYRFFSENMNQEIRLRVALTDELRAAIPDGQLFLVYQPQVTVQGGQIVGVEALVRWNHPRRGILLPGDFFAVAEGSGLMGNLGRWVLREACRQGREWIDSGVQPCTISVNLGSEDFRSPRELETAVVTVLNETGFPANFLELEITEATLINFSVEHGESIQRLRGLGVRFSLDDFGTGYSALNYLRQFPIDRIKIAREFVAEMGSGTEAASIVRLILGLSRDIGSKAIAEGVETPDQLKMLSDWGCNEVQGYYFAHPMPAEAVASLLNAGTIAPATAGGLEMVVP